MKAIRLAAPRQFEHITLDQPTSPGPNEALVRTHNMGICGTDISGYLGKMPFFSYPRIPGHELGVEVLEVGHEVQNVKPGDRCSVEPYMNCGHCFACRKGNTNCCQSLEVFGVMIDGGLREKYLIRADKLHPSETLTFDQLALVETLAIGRHACDRGDPQSGDQVLLIGAGPIGLAALEFVRLRNVRLTVMDRVQNRLEFCKSKYQVAHTIEFLGDGSEVEQINSFTSFDRYSLVIDATGSQHSMSNALTYAAQTGVVVYVGITTSEISFKHPVLHKPELTIKGSRNALPKDFTSIIGLIEDGTIDTDPWITHRTDFDSLVDVFESYTDPASGVIKAMVQL